MKILAIASVPAPLTEEQRREYLPNEVPATLSHYLDGHIEQFWFREDGGGPVFLMSAGSVEEAEATLTTLPLVAANLMTYELIPLLPLIPLRRLIQAQ